MEFVSEYRVFNRRRPIGISLSNVYTAFALMVLIEPNYFGQNVPEVDAIYQVLKVIVTLINCVLFLQHPICNRQLPLFILLEITACISTLLFSNEWRSLFVETAYIVSTIMLVCWIINKNASALIKAVSYGLGFYAIVGFIAYLVYPRGMYLTESGFTGWFFGQKNVGTPILLLAMICSIYDAVMTKGRLTLYSALVIVSSLGYMVAMKTTTGIIAACILFISLFLGKSAVICRIVSCKLIVIASFLLFLGLTFFSIQSAIGAFSAIALQFGKDATFTGRTALWAKAIDYMRLTNSFILGNGQQTSDFYIVFSKSWWAVHLHSYYLQILFQYGVVGVGIFFAFILKASRSFDKFILLKETNILKFGLMCYLLVLQVEVFTQISTFFILIFVVASSNRVEREYRRRRH